MCFELPKLLLHFRDKFINHGRVPLPSHYFAVALRCDNLTQANTCTNTTEVISVVLPHKQTDISCWVGSPPRLCRKIIDISGSFIK